MLVYLRSGDASISVLVNGRDWMQVEMKIHRIL